MVERPSSATLIMLKMLWHQITIATPNMVLEDLVEISTPTLPEIGNTILKQHHCTLFCLISVGYIGHKLRY